MVTKKLANAIATDDPQQAVAAYVQECSPDEVKAGRLVEFLRKRFEFSDSYARNVISRAKDRGLIRSKRQGYYCVPDHAAEPRASEIGSEPTRDSDPDHPTGLYASRDVLINLSSALITQDSGSVTLERIRDLFLFSRKLVEVEGDDVILPVFGNSMAPTLAPGDTVHAQRRRDEPLQDGGVYIVMSENRILMRRLHLRVDGTAILTTDRSNEEGTEIDLDDPKWKIEWRITRVSKQV